MHPIWPGLLLNIKPVCPVRVLSWVLAPANNRFLTIISLPTWWLIMMSKDVKATHTKVGWKSTWTASNIGASLLLSVVLLCTFTLIEIRNRRLSRSLCRSKRVMFRLVTDIQLDSDVWAGLWQIVPPWWLRCASSSCPWSLAAQLRQAQVQESPWKESCHLSSKTITFLFLVNMTLLSSDAYLGSSVVLEVHCSWKWWETRLVPGCQVNARAAWWRKYFKSAFNPTVGVHCTAYCCYEKWLK